MKCGEVTSRNVRVVARTTSGIAPRGPRQGQCRPECTGRTQSRRQELGWPLPILPGTPHPRPAPPSQGLYDSRFEHDACGVGFVADLPGRRSHDIVAKALTILRNLDHRGAKGSDPDTGDGAGILTQIPDGLYRAACGFAAARAGGVRGRHRLPGPPGEDAAAAGAVQRIAAQEGLRVLGWRDVPHDPAACGQGARAAAARAAPAVRRRPPRPAAARPRPARVLPAQARRARGRASTSPACRRARSCTRGC